MDFSAEYRASPEWRALNPTGKVPVMTDGDIKMFESGAMMDYWGRFADTGDPGRGTREQRPEWSR